MTLITTGGGWWRWKLIVLHRGTERRHPNLDWVGESMLRLIPIHESHRRLRDDEINGRRNRAWVRAVNSEPKNITLDGRVLMDAARNAATAQDLGGRLQIPGVCWDAQELDLRRMREPGRRRTEETRPAHHVKTS